MLVNNMYSIYSTIVVQLQARSLILIWYKILILNIINNYIYFILNSQYNLFNQLIVMLQ